MTNTNDRSSLRNYLLTTGLTSPSVDYRTSVMYSRSNNHHPQQCHPHYPNYLSSSASYSPVIPNLYSQESYRYCSELIQHHKMAAETFRVSSFSNRLNYPCLPYGRSMPNRDNATLTTRPLESPYSMTNTNTELSESAAKRPRIVRTHFYSSQITPNPAVICNSTGPNVNNTNNTALNITNTTTTNGHRSMFASLSTREISSSNRFTDALYDQSSSSGSLTLLQNDTKLSILSKTHGTHLPTVPSSTQSSSGLSTVNIGNSNPTSVGNISASPMKSVTKSDDAQEQPQSFSSKPVFKHEPRKRKIQGPSTGSADATSNSHGPTALELTSDDTRSVKSLTSSQHPLDYETQICRISTVTQTNIPNLLLISKSSGEKKTIECSSSSSSSNPVVRLNTINQISSIANESSSSRMPFQLARNSNIRAAFTIPKRPILPNPVRKHPNPLLLTSRLILKSIGDTERIKSVLQNRSDLIQTTGYMKCDLSTIQSGGADLRNIYKPVKNPNTTGTTITTATTTNNDSSNSSCQISKPRLPETKTCNSIMPKLISSEFNLSPAEELLWETGFFGKSNPQQLVCTLVYLFGKLLNLHKVYQLRQLRFGTDGQLKLVLSNKEDNTKCTPESSSSSSSSSISPDSKDKQDQSKFYLLYRPDADLDCWSFRTTDYRSSSMTDRNKSQISLDFKGSHLIPSDDTHNNYNNPNGYLLDHFPKNNHERCLVCLHIFYISKRPGFYMNSSSNSYFLAWLPEPSPNLWFRHRTIGHNHLTAILRTIDTTLDYTTRIYHLSSMRMNNQCHLKDPTELAKLASRVDVLNQPQLTGSTEQSLIPNSDCPLNLVIRECAVEDKKQQHENQQPAVHDGSPPSAHPTCMHYWPELTERARQSPWQCASCKTCTVCENKEYTTDLLICDACDKGYHVECHKPELHEPIDRSLPWVCSGCLDEGYRVAIGTLPSGMYGGISSSSLEQKPTTAADSESNLAQESARPDSDTKPDDLQPTSHDSNSTDLLQQSHSDLVNGEDKSCVKSESNSSGTPTPTNSQSDSELAKPADHNGTPLKVDNKLSPSSCANSPKQDAKNLETSAIKQDEIQDPDPTQDDNNSSKPQPCTESVQPTLTDTVSEAHPNPGPRPDDIRMWSVEHVHEWLLGEGFPREADAFLQQEIDGTCLLLMKRMDVLTELGIKLGPAVKIYERIKRLQSRCSSPV